MFGVSEFKQTKVYQEGREEGTKEGKLESVPRFLALGWSVEQMAEVLGLDVEVVRLATQE